MPVDTKFCNMPWIAHDEPDVYETDDLPDVDQLKSEATEDEQVLPKEIEQSKISANEARKRFEHCKVDATNVDFSDSIIGKRRIGYTLDCSDYEIDPNSNGEKSLITRFQRLQFEVVQLINDIDVVKNEDKNSTDGSELSAENISSLASSLKNQLEQIQLQDVFGPDLDLNNLCTYENLVHKRLLERISNFKPKSKLPLEEKSNDVICLELYTKPSDKTDAINEKALELDRRLHRLETLVGRPVDGKISPGGLLEIASKLSEKVSLFQPAYLDQVEARMANIQTKLNIIPKNLESTVITDTDSVAKITELFDLVKKWQSFSDVLPTVIDRLQDLQTLHEQASEFSTQLVNMNLSQKKIEENLSIYGVLLKEVQESVSNTLSVFRENFDMIQQASKSVSS